MKYIIFDSGPLINFSMNSSLHLLRKLKKTFNGKFLITEKVKTETIDYPEKVRRFELGALQLEALFKDRIIELPKFNKGQIEQLRKGAEEIMTLANSTFRTKKKNLHLIHEGEATTLSLSEMLKAPNVIAVDERTIRMLCENPENLRKLLQKKLHASVNSNSKNYAFFKKFKMIRSTELVYIAHKKGLFNLKDPRALKAMLYAMKYKGCSVSKEEIEEMVRL
jgi:hypothetical protein